MKNDPPRRQTGLKPLTRGLSYVTQEGLESWELILRLKQPHSRIILTILFAKPGQDSVLL